MKDSNDDNHGSDIIERRIVHPNIEDNMNEVEMSLMGIIIECTNEPDTKTIYFRINVKGYSDNMLCRYQYNSHYPLMKGDTAYIKGFYLDVIFMARYQKCFEVSIITCRYEFDLVNFLSDVFPQMIDSDALKRLAYNIQDYANTYYQEGVEGVVDCLNNLSTNLSRSNQEIETFTEHLYGREEFFHERVKTVRSFLARYCNDSLKRPLQLLGVPDNEIEEIYTPLYDAYKICIINPYRLPEISSERAEKICTGHLRLKEIPKEWSICGAITRFIYNNLKKKNWTSTPITRIQSSFPTSFDKYKDLLMKEYFCFEEFDHIYYIPIMKKEEFVSKFMAKLIKEPEFAYPDPIYCGAEPDEYQKAAIKGCLTNKTAIMTGGPGVGKTKSLGHIAQNIIKNGGCPLFVAYTGVASQRIKKSLKEAEIPEDKRKCMTIHMAISIQSILIDFNISHVIFDEVSMLDMSLFARFISAFINLKLNYIFSGDIDQLEQIGYGSVFQQLLKTPIKKFVLETNHRSQLGILTMINEVINEDRIRSQMPIKWRRDFPDYQFYEGDINMMRHYIQFQFDQFDKTDQDKTVENFIKYRDMLMIVTPGNKTCTEVNPIFQEIFMKGFDFTILDNKKYHIHDRVMKLVNNHSIEVMNGELGKIIEIQNDFVVVKFREEDGGTTCPFFGKDRLRKVKEIQKAIGNAFSPFIKDDNGVKVEKNPIVIRDELNVLRGKMVNFAGKNFGPNDVSDFFDVAMRYPFAMFTISGESEFMSLDSIKLAYCLTTNKAQGDQYTICVYFLPGKSSFFVSRKNIYTGMSRAKEKLIIMAESETLLNSCISNPGRFTHELLAVRVNSKLDPKMVEQMNSISQIEELDCYDNDFDGDGDGDGGDLMDFYN